MPGCLGAGRAGTAPPVMGPFKRGLRQGNKRRREGHGQQGRRCGVPLSVDSDCVRQLALPARCCRHGTLWRIASRESGEGRDPAGRRGVAQLSDATTHAIGVHLQAFVIPRHCISTGTQLEAHLLSDPWAVALPER